MVRHASPTVSLVAFAAFSLFVAACGKQDLGESCDKGGTTDECVDNAVCQTNKNGAQVCLKICKEQADCAANEECNGGQGSYKSCKGVR